jgi:hypothetical protein
VATAFVQALAFGNSASVASVIGTWTTTGGNAVLISVGVFNNSTATITVTDDKGNTYNLVTNTDKGIGSTCTKTFLALNITGGATQITVAVSPNQLISCTAQEISGVATSSAVDQSSGLYDTGTTPWGGTAITTANASDYLYSAAYCPDSAVNLVAGAGYTEPTGAEYDRSTGETISSAYQVVAATGTYQCNWTSNVAQDTFVIQIALKAAATTVSDSSRSIRRFRNRSLIRR